MERLSLLLCIYKNLEILLPNPDAADGWVKQANRNPMFVTVTGRFRVLRDAGGQADALLALDDYNASQPFGVQQRSQGRAGIVYPSVRDHTGECVAVFRTHALSPATQCAHYGYVWDGQQITDVITLGDSGIAPHG